MPLSFVGFLQDLFTSADRPQIWVGCEEIFATVFFHSGLLRRRWTEIIASFDQHLALPRKRYNYGHSYIERRIGTRMLSIQWCHIQRPWVTSQGHDIVPRQITIKNGTRYCYTYNGRPIGSRTWPKEWWCFNDLERSLTKIWKACHYSTYNI